MLVTDRIYFVLATMNNDPFAYINGSAHGENIDANRITTDGIILSMSMSWVGFMEVLGALGIVISLIVCGIKLVIFKNDPREVTETKKKFIVKIFITIVIFAFIGLAGLGFDIAAEFTK